MKILYGVQATGNGHITRARAMNHQFQQTPDIDVDFLFSGRKRDDFFDMQAFGGWQCYQGLTFAHHAGGVRYIKTLRQNSLRQLYGDITSIDLSRYDLVITDFEPITAWAAKKQGKTCVGVGHQYAFNHNVPLRGESWAARAIMKQFAPCDIALGLHWHHFNHCILPPIVETHNADTSVVDPKKIVVYLGFEEPEAVIKLLEPFDDHLFVYYAPFKSFENRGHIQLKPLSREGFQKDLATSGGVICNAGFELSSEAIHLGKKLLVKPLKGQMEQLSNAEAVNRLELGMTMDTLDQTITKQWLDNWQSKQICYPNVAQAITAWVAQGDWKNKQDLANSLWRSVTAESVRYFQQHPTPALQN